MVQLTPISQLPSGVSNTVNALPTLVPPRRALEESFVRGNYPATVPAAQPRPNKSRQELEDEFWADEFAQVKKAYGDLKDIHDGIANDDPRDVRRTNDRGALLRTMLDEPYSHGASSALRKVQDANRPAIEAAKAAARSNGSTSRKRKLGASLEDDIAEYKQDLSHIEIDDMMFDLNCNQVRSRINRVLDSGIMKKGEFCNAIRSSNAAVNNFLQQTGPLGGSQSEAYGNAWGWFKQREIAGLRMPDVKKRQKTEAAATLVAMGNSSAAAAAAPPCRRTAGATVAVGNMPDISQIHLPGEETDSVPVYDSCDEVRKKISSHLQTPGLTQAEFCRTLFAQLHAPRCSSIQSKTLNDFRGKKGPSAGATSSVFYAAYVYFEKLRLAREKPKSKHREEMEQHWNWLPGGFNRTHDGRGGVTCLAGEVPVEDQYGRHSFWKESYRRRQS